MNIQADPVGYKALSRHFAAAKVVDQEVADEVREQGAYLRIIAWSVVALAVLAVLLLLHEGRAIAMPIVLGFVVGLIFGPLGDRGARFGIPAPLTILGAIVIAFGLLGSVLYLITPTVSEFSAAVPRIQQGFDRVVKNAEGLFAVVEQVQKGDAGTNGAIVAETKTSKADMAAKVAGILTPSIAEFVIFLFTLLFFVSSRQEIRTGIVRMFSEREKRLSAMRAFSEAEGKLTDYMFTIAGINAALGLTVAAVFWLLGVPGALVWGFLVFVFNFLPVVGPLLIKGALLVFGIATYPALLPGLMPLGVFLLISLIEANAVTPKIIGNKITISPLMVFLSVVIWTWMWGFAGAFLAMPILAIGTVIKQHFLTKSTAPSLPA